MLTPIQLDLYDRTRPAQRIADATFVSVHVEEAIVVKGAAYALRYPLRYTIVVKIEQVHPAQRLACRVSSNSGYNLFSQPVMCTPRQNTS